MPRYKLRTLLILLAIGPPMLAGAWYFGGCGKVGVSRYSHDATIRNKLLTHTPPGTTASDVLSFVFDSLRHEEYVNANIDYVQHYKAATGRDNLPVIQTDDKTIEVIVTEWPVHFMMSELVIAIWHFDEKDRLSDIIIDRRTMGP